MYVKYSGSWTLTTSPLASWRICLLKRTFFQLFLAFLSLLINSDLVTNIGIKSYDIVLFKNKKYLTFSDFENSKWLPKAKKMGAKLGKFKIWP